MQAVIATGMPALFSTAVLLTVFPLNDKGDISIILPWRFVLPPPLLFAGAKAAAMSLGLTTLLVGPITFVLMSVCRKVYLAHVDCSAAAKPSLISFK
ncbi:MAG: hypothetical protein ACI9P7_001036 [Candidatus Azotimanducaceae bacterium]|jgi:hypothetical protein